MFLLRILVLSENRVYFVNTLRTLFNMDRYKDIKSRLLEYARSHEDIRAVVAIGSSNYI